MIHAHLDWLAFGCDSFGSAVPAILPPRKGTLSGRFHQLVERFPGFERRSMVKDSAKNRAEEWEFRGECFSDAPFLPLSIAYAAQVQGLNPRVFRVDVAFDFIDTFGDCDLGPISADDFDALDVVVKGKSIRRRSCQHFFEDHEFSGIKVGKSDVVVRVYDKYREQAKKRDGFIDANPRIFGWWRVEVQLRGDTCKAISAEFPVSSTFDWDYIEAASALIRDRVRLPQWMLDHLVSDRILPKMHQKQTTAIGRAIWRLETAARNLREYGRITGCEVSDADGMLRVAAQLREIQQNGGVV